MLHDVKTNFKIVYLLGAGFSNALTDGNAPLTRELGKKLENSFPEEIKQRFNFAPDNIESFFTKLDLEILPLKQLEQDCSKLEEIRRKASREIADIFATKKLFCLENGKIKIPESADRVCKILFHKNDTILTLNYDCALENILFVQGKWSTIGGWSKFRFNQDNENRDKKLNIEILKLHGSINFVLVATLDGDKFDYNNLQLKWFVDKELFPNCHETTSWEEQIVEYIVLPSYLKQFEYSKIVSLWKEAVFKVREADKIVIIGCALREEDYLLRFLLSFVSRSSKIIIIDPSAENIKNKLLKIVPIDLLNIEPINSRIENLADDILKNMHVF